MSLDIGIDYVVFSSAVAGESNHMVHSRKCENLIEHFF